MSSKLNEVRALRTVTRHISNVQKNMRKVIRPLTERAEVHDQSKLQDDEFYAVLHYQKLDGYHYGGDEYKAAMDEIRPFTEKGWQLHTERNRHHPEHHGDDVSTMNFLDIIEMVCDWKAANETYNTSGQTFRDAALECKKRYNFSEGQEWLIFQLIIFLDDFKPPKDS